MMTGEEIGQRITKLDVHLSPGAEITATVTYFADQDDVMVSLGARLPADFVRATAECVVAGMQMVPHEPAAPTRNEEGALTHEGGLACWCEPTISPRGIGHQMTVDGETHELTTQG
jgi:hypothetical protein